MVKNSAQWILEGDIRACFDCISHDWLLNNVLIDTRVLKQWLKAGYIEKQTLFQTPEGTPQGGIISPVLANLALDGLENVIKLAFKGKADHKVHMIRYADDFVVTGPSQEILEQHIKPAIVNFLQERGLTLSEEKTSITHIDNGFDFLGFNLRKYQGKLLIKPAKKSVKALLDKSREVIKKNKTATTYQLISQLNPKIKGWAYYYRHVVAKQTFADIDDCIYRLISQWTRRRHHNKNMTWIRKKYFHRHGRYNWIFFGTCIKENGEKITDNLVKASSIRTVRHPKIRQNARLYDPEYTKYFAERKQNRKDKLYHYNIVSKLGLFDERIWQLT